MAMRRSSGSCRVKGAEAPCRGSPGETPVATEIMNYDTTEVLMLVTMTTALNTTEVLETMMITLMLTMAMSYDTTEVLTETMTEAATQTLKHDTTEVLDMVTMTGLPEVCGQCAGRPRQSASVMH